MFVPLVLSLATTIALTADEQRVSVEDVEARATFSWPDALYGGYFPMRIELQSRREEETEVSVVARHQLGFDEVRKRVRLGPGERYTFELLGRAEVDAPDLYSIEVRVAGTSEWISGFGANEHSSGDRQVLLAVTANPLPAGRTEEWTQELGEEHYAVGEARFSDLSARLEAYSSLDVVLLDAARGLPPDEVLEPLFSWMRLGGTVVVYGPGAAAEAGRRDGLAEWIEGRFELDRDDAAGASAHAAAHGRLVVLESSDPFADPAAGEFLNRHVDHRADNEGWTPRPKGSRANRNTPSEQPIAQLPLRALAAMLVIFALVIGPANFVVVRKLGRPVLLLFTVPAIALTAALCLLAYGVLYQGLDVKVVSNSWTVLDQRQRRASTAEVRNLFVGSSPGAGLRPGPGTACFAPLGTRVWRAEQERFFLMDLSDGVLLGADYVPVRQITRHVLLGDGPARARLAVERAGERIEVTNGLGARLLELTLRDRDGRWFRLDAELADGGTAELAACGQAAGARAGRTVLRGGFGAERERLPAGCYVATLDRSPFVDDCGLELNELAGEHVVLGVLGPEARDER